MKTKTPRLLRVIFDGFAKLEEWIVGGPHTHLILRATDSVAILLYDETNERFLLVRQKRVSMIRKGNPKGFITEAIAGRFDVKLGPKALAIKEALEEAGATLTEHEVELLNNGKPMALSAGILTERSYLAFAIIKPEKLIGDDHDTFGVPEEGEAISRVWIPRKDINAFEAEDVRVLALIQHLKLKLLERDLGKQAMARMLEVSDRSMW